MASSVVLFDVDGVLLDSMSAYRHAWGRWATSRGLSLEEIRGVAYGRRPIDIVRSVAPNLDAFAELNVFRALMDAEEGVEAMTGAAALLRALSAGRWGVVSSGERAEVVGRMARAGLPSSVVTVCGDDLPVGKPDPSGYRLAAWRLGAPPRGCIVVEDSPVGVTAGRRAGMEVVALSTTHRAAQLASADRVYPSLAEAAPYLLARAGVTSERPDD